MIVLIGESASGKSTIEKELENRGISKIISYTTRPIRDGEIDGIDYHYITDQKFNELLAKDFFVEHTNYNGWYYGSAKKDCLNNSIMVADPHGLRQLKKINNIHIVSFYIKVSQKERLIRLVKRDENILETFRRIISDQGVFQGIEDEVDCVISGECSVKQIADFIEGFYFGRT